MNFQDKNGRFPMNYHHHAHACNLLLDLGVGGNKLIDKAINFIISRQRDDGGWLHRNNLPKGMKYDNAPSCICIVTLLRVGNSNLFTNVGERSNSVFTGAATSSTFPGISPFECMTIHC